MTEADRKSLESELPPGWQVMAKLTQETPKDHLSPVHYHTVTMQAVSNVHNVVLEGTFAWIKKKAIAYALSGRSPS